MRGRAWTPDEDAALVGACGACTGWDAVAERLPGRTKRAVVRRADRLGVAPQHRYVEWTDDEVGALGESYPTHGPRWAGWADALPGRTVEQIRARANYDGLRQPRSRWTPEEDRALSLVLARLSAHMGRPATCVASRMRMLAREPRRAAL